MVELVELLELVGQIGYATRAVWYALGKAGFKGRLREQLIGQSPSLKYK